MKEKRRQSAPPRKQIQMQAPYGIVCMMTNRIHNKLSRRRLPSLAVIVLHVAALALLCSAQSGLNPRFGSLPKDEPQAVYHPDPGDTTHRGPAGGIARRTQK